MKRILSFVIALVLMLTLSACSAEFADRFTTYTATFTVVVPNSGANETDILSNLQIARLLRLTTTVASIIKMDSFLMVLIEKTGVSLTTSQLRERLSFESIEDTDMLEVSVTSDDRQQAIDIAQAIAEIMPEFIEEVVEGLNVQVVDTPTVTENFSIGKLFR